MQHCSLDWIQEQKNEKRGNAKKTCNVLNSVCELHFLFGIKISRLHKIFLLERVR